MVEQLFNLFDKHAQGLRVVNVLGVIYHNYDWSNHVDPSHDVMFGHFFQNTCARHLQYAATQVPKLGTSAPKGLFFDSYQGPNK
jgi:hypothetical protein